MLGVRTAMMDADATNNKAGTPAAHAGQISLRPIRTFTIVGRHFEKGGLDMLRISMAIVFGTLVASSPVGISIASADTWGCSYEKCLPACAKAGGRSCGAYCSKALRDKRVQKICQ
jgi:hypothetical protein